MAYILQSTLISVASTWDNMQFCSWISKFVPLSQPSRQPTYMMQNITGNSWETMFASFKTLVSHLYLEWTEYLWDFLTPEDRYFFRSILHVTASENDWQHSLNKLTFLLAQKSKRRVIIFIDEYEAPSNCAYECDFFKKVCPSYPFWLQLGLKKMFQANLYFGRDILPSLLKVTTI